MGGINDNDIINFEANTKLERARQIPRSIYEYNRENWNALKEKSHVLLLSDSINTLKEVNAEQPCLNFKSSIFQVLDK